ncbi:hypothetical protein Tco_0292258 [Tanacetum coccineum]
MIPEPGDANHAVSVNETFHEQIDDELTEKELKQVEADDQAIQTILLGLPEDIYAAVDSCETAQEIYRHVTIVHQTKDLHTADYTQLYDFLKYNQKEVDDLRAEQLAKTHDPLALMANSINPFNYHVFHQDLPSLNRQMQMVGGNGGNQIRQYVGQNVRNKNGYNAVQNVGNQVWICQILQEISQKRTRERMSDQEAKEIKAEAEEIMPQPSTSVRADAVMKCCNAVTKWVVTASYRIGDAVSRLSARAEGNENGNNGNQIRCYNYRGLGHLARNCTEEVGIQLQVEEFELMAAAVDLDEIEEVNANCILMANLQQAKTSGTQTDKAPVYDSDGSVEPIPEPHQVQQNDSNVISEVSSLEQGGGIVEQHLATIEETRAYFESLYNNLATKVEKVNSVNRKLRETNADLTTKLARYKNQEKCFEISQEKYDKLERCYQKFVYQEKCLTKKINALHLSSGKQITTLNEEITNLNNPLSKENSIVSSLQEEKKWLKSDFKIREDKLLDKQIQLENKIKELDNILKMVMHTKLVDGKETSIPPITVEEKAQRRAELKARSTLLMALPNEHQLKFNTYKDAKLLMQAIENRFEGNTATKKTQKNLLKQQYENFVASSTEFLRSLSQEWVMHTIVWRNKPEIETLSLDDLFNNLKAYESKGVNTVSTQGAANSSKSGDHFSNAMIYSFFASQPRHFSRECKAPRNQDSRNQDSRNKEPTRRIMLIEVTTSNALVSQCDGFGYDWSDQAEEGPTNSALMAYSLTSSNSSTNSKIMDKCKIGIGYNVVPPPCTGNFMPPKHDLVYPSLDDFVEVNKSASEFVVKKPSVETNEPMNARKENGALIIKDWVSESEEKDVPKIKTVEMFNKPSFAKINFVKSTEQVKSPRKTSVDKNRQNTPSPRGNKRN